MNQISLGLLVTALSLGSFGCGKTTPATYSNDAPPALPPVDSPADDGTVVHGRAMYTVTSEQESLASRLMNFLWKRAYAASSASTTVTYTNAAATNFAINVSGFAPGSMSGSTLSLGNVAVSTLSDNNLKVCGTNGNSKCTQAIIRVYTTGTTAGFVNTADAYGVPVYTGTLNPTTAVGLLAAGSVPVQTVTVAANKHNLTISDFPTPSYAVTSDFSNAGAGSYTMTYVVEYVLSL